MTKEVLDEVGATHLTKKAKDVLTFGRLVPEEELTLGKFFFLCLGRPDGLEGVGMKPCVPCFGGDGHGGRGEVLHLFKLEIEVLGQCGKFCHVFRCTARVTADEVGDDLLTQILASVQFIEDVLEIIEEFERGFAHQVEHSIGSVFGCHFQTTTHMLGNEFFGVLTIDAVNTLITCVMEQKVIADT